MRSPQNNFFDSIKNILNEIKNEDPYVRRIFDCPGGDGIITKELATSYSDLHFSCVDISEAEISKLMSSRLPENLDYAVGDLHKMNIACDQFDVWLIINSLFLLPDLDDVLQKLKNFKYVIIIIPNINSKYYNLFETLNPEVNINPLSIKDVLQEFNNVKFREIRIKPLGYLPRFKINILNKLVKYISFIDKYPIFNRVNNYYIIAFKREVLA